MKLNNLHMTADGANVAVGWDDDDGSRYHVWLEVADGQPVPPYRVRKTRRMGKRMVEQTLYRNPPLGTRLGDDGYFGTQYLRADAKAHAPFVTLALRRAEDEGLFAKAVATRRAAEEAEQVARKLKLVDGIRAGLEGREFKRPGACIIAKHLCEADTDDLHEIAMALRAAGV
jgi:hypothetical protein